jgi:hypothetical protein
MARVRLEQAFRNHHADPLAVTYVLPLPADAAVAGYAFTVGDRRIEGEVDRIRSARSQAPAAAAGPFGGAPLARMRGKGAAWGAPPHQAYSAAPRPRGETRATQRYSERASFGPGKETPRREVARAREVSRARTKLVLELEVLAEIRLDEAAIEGAVAVVWLDDGSRVHARVDVAQSTRMAHLAPGQYARIVLILDEETARAVKRLTFEPDLGLDVPLT